MPTFFQKVQNVTELVRPLLKQHQFRNPFDSQHIKGSQTVVKSASEIFYQIFSILWDTLIWKLSPLVIC